MTKILVMDDDPRMIRTLKDCFLSFSGYKVIGVETGQEVLELLQKDCSVDVAFFDIENGKGFGGVETIEMMKRNNPTLPFPIIVMSGNAKHDAIENPKKYGFVSSFEKTSMTLQNLKDAVEEALKKVGA